VRSRYLSLGLFLVFSPRSWRTKRMGRSPQWCLMFLGRPHPLSQDCDQPGQRGEKWERARSCEPLEAPASRPRDLGAL
jgi:hypothetical protein